MKKFLAVPVNRDELACVAVSVVQKKVVELIGWLLIGWILGNNISLPVEGAVGVGCAFGRRSPA